MDIEQDSNNNTLDTLENISYEDIKQIEDTQIGNGTFGKVRIGTLFNNVQVALKELKLLNETEGFPLTAIREIKILSNITHKNIIKLHNILYRPNEEYSKGIITMVFEYLKFDLSGLITYFEYNNRYFSISEIKYIAHEVLHALSYLHEAGYMHRDIKGANVLIGSNGEIKLCDFGLTRSIEDRQIANEGGYTNTVVTLWYRAPELLLGSTTYTNAIDMWSFGCLLIDLLTKTPAFNGNTEIEQLHQIYKICGSPNEQNFPDMSSCPWYRLHQQFRPEYNYPRRVREYWAYLDKTALDLIDNLLLLDPAKRFTVEEALAHEWFNVEPLPSKIKISNLPEFPCHDYETSLRFKKRKRKEKE